ncbi:hypothetical protein [Hufsiella ginkgonis]|uniref:Uncharacterized protein n=1 Tax=Hufsiella ginkgonis TaxID=2695274 RepID=A0A7K1XU16_9SPHI|nr:hypothetical protein [Hufsiella ginkgonis]MXV14287.1 hypothetical protein [Hufsiella ginkgonis]
MNFLKGKTKVSDDKNIELLAWLIDFEPRPYQYGENYLTPEAPGVPGTDREETQTPNPEIPEFPELPEPSDGPRKFPEEKEETQQLEIVDTGVTAEKHTGDKKGWMFKRRNIAISLLLLLLGGCGGYQLWSDRHSASKYALTGREQCMYWAEDHYQPVLCNETIEGVSIIPLEKNKVDRFRRITDLRTLTAASVGKVWYLKKDNKVDFFTDTGFHPVFTGRRLRPASRYILDTYAFHVKSPWFQFLGIDVYL